MGETNKSKTTPQETKSIREVYDSFQELKKELYQQPEIEKNSIISENLKLMENAVETVWQIHNDRNGQRITSIEFYQTYQALQSFKGFAFSYSQTNDNKYRDKIYEISGHFVDRISQKVLEWGGKTGLEDYYNEMKQNYQELNSILLLLKSSAETLNQYTSEETIDTLHAESAKDVKEYTRTSRNWLALTSITALVLISVIIYAMFTTSNFISSQISSITGEANTLYVLYTISPTNRINYLLGSCKFNVLEKLSII